MFISKKEKRVTDLVLQHIDKTGECLDMTCEAIRKFLSGKEEGLDVTASQVSILENEADKLLREIREMLYSGAYLPTIRGDVYRLMSAVDNVANKAEDCCDFFIYQKPHIAEEYQAEILAIVELTQGCFSEFSETLKMFFSQKNEEDGIREHAKRVSELESLIDDNERTLTEQIFNSSLPLSEKIHLRRLLHRLVYISDNIEDAADELQLLNLKSIV